MINRDDSLDFIVEKMTAYGSLLSDPSGLHVVYKSALDEIRDMSDIDEAKRSMLRLEKSIDSLVSGLIPMSLRRKALLPLEEKYKATKLTDFIKMKEKRSNGPSLNIVDSEANLIQSILERGTVSNDDEAAFVRDFVANLSNEEEVGTDVFNRLAYLLDEAGY